MCSLPHTIVCGRKELFPVRRECSPIIILITPLPEQTNIKVVKKLIWQAAHHKDVHNLH